MFFPRPDIFRHQLKLIVLFFLNILLNITYLYIYVKMKKKTVENKWGKIKDRGIKLKKAYKSIEIDEILF